MKNKYKALCLGFLLSITALSHPCTTFYGANGDTQFCVNDSPESYESNEDVCPMCGQMNCDDDWTQGLGQEEGL